MDASPPTGVLVALSLGANLGDRAAALAHAVERLAQTPGYRLLAASSRYETAPVGGPEQPDYLNQVVVLAHSSTAGATAPAAVARSLLGVCHSIEQDLNRVREVRWGPRTLDVDILMFGDLTSDDPELTVPHPRLQERAFVLIPWAEVAPDMTVPGVGSVAALAQRLAESERASVRRLES